MTAKIFCSTDRKSWHVATRYDALTSSPETSAVDLALPKELDRSASPHCSRARVFRSVSTDLVRVRFRRSSASTIKILLSLLPSVLELLTPSSDPVMGPTGQDQRYDPGETDQNVRRLWVQATRTAWKPQSKPSIGPSVRIDGYIAIHDGKLRHVRGQRDLAADASRNVEAGIRYKYSGRSRGGENASPWTPC